MTSLLFEEINEVKSIYRTINEQLIEADKIVDLKELVNAIKAKVAACINALERIEHNMIKGLEILSRKNRKAYSALYTQISYILDRMKYRAVALNHLTNMINLYIYLLHNTKYKISLMVLKKIVNNIKELLGSTLDINIYVLAEHNYSTINILKEYNVAVLCIPSYDLLKPWKWALLFHELGHLLFDANKEVFVREFRRRIMPLLKQLAPTSVNKEYVDRILSVWEQYWLEEFVSDLYGVALGGPAYTHAFAIEVFNSNPSGCTGTHPSLDSRMYLQLRYLDNIEEVKELTDNLRRLWSSHRENIVVEGLGYPFTSSVLDELSKIFANVIGKPPFLSYVHEVIGLRERIDRGEDVKANPLHLILALALSNRGKEEKIQKRIIEAIAEDQ